MSSKLNYWLSLILVLTLAEGLTAQGVDPGKTHLKHSWTFEDGTPNDYVGGSNGALVGDPVIQDGALIIQKQGQWMEMIGDDLDLRDYNELTLEAWYTPTAGANAGYTMLAYFGDLSPEGSGSDGLFITAARGDNKSRIAISIGAQSSPYAHESGADGPEYDDGNLHHMVGTVTGDSIKLYMDGILTGANKLSATNGIWGISTNYAYLAKSGYNADAQWIGEIQEFNIFDKALSAEEVLFQYQRFPSTGVDQIAPTAIPTAYVLSQNYPNPFNPTTTITYDLTRKSAVNIAVYDMLGQEVAALMNEVKPAGRYRVQFNGMDLSGGVYLCRMVINGELILTKKMMLLK